MGIIECAPWSAEESQRACQLWLSGESASQIAAKLGTGRTRNAIIGRLNRTLGTGRTRNAIIGRLNRKLGADAVRGAPKTTPRNGVPGKIINAALAARVKSSPKISAPLVQVAGEPPLRPEGYIGKRIGALKAGECCYIENEPGEALYCAAPTAPGSSYCPAHHRRCYQAGTAWRGGKRAGGLASFARHRDGGAHYVVGWVE